MKSILFVFIHKKEFSVQVVSTSVSAAWKAFRLLHPKERGWKLSGGIK